jgi:hypothetical protein
MKKLREETHKGMSVGQVASFRMVDPVLASLVSQAMEATGARASELLEASVREGLMGATQHILEQRKAAQDRMRAQLVKASEMFGKPTMPASTSGKAPSVSGIADSAVPGIVAVARKPRKP